MSPAAALSAAGALLAASAAAASADQLACRFDGAPDIAFGIDRSQFAPPHDPAEPPRRKVSRIRVGPRSFLAEPMLVAGGVRGFWTDDPATGSHLLTTMADGSAIYTAPDGRSYRGQCEDTG